MNQVFSLDRWLLYTEKHWSENRKKYLLSLAAIGALLLIWYCFMLLVERRHPLRPDQQAINYFVGLFLTGCFFGSFIFGDLSGGTKAIHFLSVPASTFEKLLTALLYCVLLFFVAYTIVFYLVDFTMMKVHNSVATGYWNERNPGIPYQPVELVNIFHFEGRKANEFSPYNMLFLVYIAVQAAFILGSVYFPKYSFIKTAISLLLISLFVAFFIGKILYPMLPAGNFRSSTSFVLMGNNNPSYTSVITLPKWIGEVLKFLFQYAFAPIFWVVTYFRLKEKEV